MIYDKKFSEANLSDLDFSENSQFENCEFSAIQFSGHLLRGALFNDCQFASCNLANQDFMNATIVRASFNACNMIGINWCNVKRVEDLQFKESKINFSSFQGLKLKKIRVESCQALDVDFSSCDLTGAVFAYSNLAGSNFNGALIENADFRWAKDYLFDLRKSKVKGVKLTMPEALNLITVLGAEIEF